MNRTVLIVITVLACVLGFISYKSKRMSDQFAEFRAVNNSGTVVSKMPDISFGTLDSSESYNFYKDADRTKLTFLHFWATWCAPCEEEFPMIQRLMAQLDDEVSYLLVAVNDEPKKIKKFLKKFPSLKGKILLDSSSAHQKFFGVYKLPETFIVGRDGAILKKYEGAKEWSPDLIPDI